MNGETRAGALTWLHLSDLHVSGEGWQQDDVLDALVRDVPKLLEARGLRPDLLFVTGDVAGRGRRPEYDGAFIVLDELARRLGLERREQVFVVPGNHDVDRARIGRLARRDHASLLALESQPLRDAVGELLGTPNDFALYGERLSEWCAFTEKLLGRARSVSMERPWRSDVVDVGGLPVGVLSLCTAWTSGPDDRKGSLVLGERQIRDMVAEARDGGARLVIALMHHPLHWLHDGEHSAIRGRLERDVDVVLHGHVHDAHAALHVAAGSAHVEIGAGAAYAGLGQDSYHGFSVGHLDLVHGRLDVHGFTWSTRSGKWHPDAGTPGADEHGRVSLPFSSTRIAGGEPRVAGHEVLATRLRHAAAKVYATVDFAGLGAGGPRRHVTLEKIFVPLRLTATDLVSPSFAWFEGDFEEEFVIEREEPQDSPHLVFDANGLVVPPEGRVSRAWAMGSGRIGPEGLEAMLAARRKVVVLGGPGSGKSTLTRYLASTIARREGGPAPLLLTVRDWIAEGKREGLLDMVARQATTLLSVRTDREALEALCDDGRVLLLVDGLDEVADAAGRRDLRDRLHAFITRFPRVPVLVTSRLAGYHEVPLDHEQEFDELRLERFDDEALEQFVHRWYDLVESDPGERLRKRVNLLRALEVEPRAKELARNPLMATLIGMVHFFHAQLPGDRAKLYGMVIDLLLVTWPAEHGRELAELHGTVQQPMLEALALRLQERRATEETHPDWQKVEVLVEVATLEELLAELLAERFPERGAGELRHLARKWGKWLVDGSGLLQEQRPGRVGFLHLSLMEYMAGRALFEQHSSLGHAAVARVVAERRDRAVWRETLLLMLGGESRKRDLGRQVVEQLLEREDVVPQWSACTFGLALLREEVDIGEQRERLLEGACRAAIEVWPFQWKDAFHPLFDVVRFGRTHGQATRTWLLDALASVCGEPLIGVVAMACEALPWELVEPRLAARLDAPMVAQTLLELGHAHPAGAWARAHATTEVWTSWARTTPLVGVQSRSFESLAGSGRCGAWIPRSMARAGWVAATTEQAAARLRTKTREDGRRGLPSAITWTTPHAKHVEARLDFSVFDPRLGEGSFAGGPDDFSRDFARHFTRSHAREFARELSRHHSSGFPQPFARDFARELARHFALDFALDFSHYYDLDIALDFAPDFARYLARHFAQSFERNLVHDFAHDAPLDFSHDFASTISVAETSCAAPHTAASSWEGLRRAQDRDSANDFAAALFAAMVGDAHAGLLTIPGLVHPHDASILAAIRIQNRWLGLFFTSLVDHATRSRSLPEHPELHALLLTYGLVQYQTTWAWPDCPYWRSWLADGPPAHWLPAHVWHLVRSIQEPADSGHCERATTALDRNDWPELAQALRETTLVPTPPEVLALFDHGDTPDSAPPSA